MTENLLKEAFISNLNGTSIAEVALGLSIGPMCFLFRGLVLVFYQKEHRALFYSWKHHLFFDFLLLVVPQVLSCTVFSDFLYFVLLAYAAISALLLCYIFKWRTNCVHRKPNSIIRSFLKIQVRDEIVPAVTNLRVFLNILTAISILAVDFKVFPRRYAKTETYGTGVMDLGVGGFVFANAIVSPEAKTNQDMLQSKIPNFKKQLLSVWPLILFGFGRLISVKAADYQEHVSEYGIHWNFFFTLANVRVLGSLLLAILPAKNSWIVAATIVLSYQAVLEYTSLKEFIFYGSDGNGTRVGFFNANREGIVSVIGYVAIYMAGVQVGLYLLKKRAVLKDWISPIKNLMLIAFSLFIMFYIFQAYLEPASRRLANLTFFIWIIAQCVSFLCLILLCDLIITFAKYLVTGSKVPVTWYIYMSSNLSKGHETAPQIEKKESHYCLIEAVNRNQLLFFILSNILTGLVNMIIDTMHCNSFLSVTVILIYMFCNCMVVYVFHINKITVKWW
ncbi:hypothetical protein GDO86_003399 [Hymenochirus boettgeri]|uniref:Phosphatidylinositol-glycan biosynthesis class W protein n=1 Tax=Hymenochirus boettgeri TaxID=247094 RepID=A0A8T2K9C4_9PIPI|nr:hypothetical protein GDO86_003399 [Hymenochirus boettgeri]